MRRPADNKKAPLVCFIGRKNAGKTAFIEKLVALLSGAGLRVAYIKHDAHQFSMDHPGTDTFRVGKAGAQMVIISSPAQVACLKNVETEADLAQLSKCVSGSIELIVAEGYKSAGADRIEVSRGPGSDLVCREEDLLAVVSDRPRAARTIPVFSPEAADQVARFLAVRYNLKISLGQKWRGKNG